MSKKTDVGDYVERQIKWYSENEYLARPQLSKLKQGAGRSPGDIPEISGMILRGIPAGFIGEDGYASKEEWACYTALTLFALHQHGHNIKNNCMSTKNYASIGTAANRLKRMDENLGERILKYIQSAITANDISGVVTYIRPLIQMFQKKDIPLNYRTFAEDLYTLQFPDGRTKIGLKWSQDLYRYNKEDKDNE